MHPPWTLGTNGEQITLHGGPMVSPVTRGWSWQRLSMCSPRRIFTECPEVVAAAPGR